MTYQLYIRCYSYIGKSLFWKIGYNGDLEAYKWVHDTIEKEIDDRIAEGFKDHISDFVDCKDLYSGDCEIFTVSH